MQRRPSKAGGRAAAATGVTRPVVADGCATRAVVADGCATRAVVADGCATRAGGTGEGFGLRAWRVAAIVASLALLLATVGPASPGGAAALAPFSAIAPARLADTRPGGATIDGQGSGVGPVTALTVVVGGRAGVPLDAKAVMLNVTATGAANAGFLTVYPCGEAQPWASNLNFSAAETVPNAVMAKVGAGGAVCFGASSPVQVIVDLSGWYPAAGSVNPTAPARLADTRPAAVTFDGQGSGGGPVTNVAVVVAGRAGVAPDAQAAVLNVTVTGPAAPGYVTVYPCGEAQPWASNLNFNAGQTVANLVVAKVGSGGAVCLSSVSPAHLVVDLNGWYPAGADITPMAPARAADTRPQGTTADGAGAGTGLVGAGVTLDVAVAGRVGVPADASAAVLNVTVTGPAEGGFATVFPCGAAQPWASNLNFSAGQTVANLVLARLGEGGRVCVYTTAALHVVVDVNAWLSGPPPPALSATTMLAGCPMFPADNPWNRDISAFPVRGESPGWVAAVGAGNLHPDFGSNPSYGIPFTVVGPGQPPAAIIFDGYPDQTDPGPYPIPANAPVEAGGDRHVLVLQQVSCQLAELFDARPSGGGWRASNGARFDLRSNALRPNGWTSADAAGLPILAGLVRFDEVKSGRITHALRFTVPSTQRGYIYPATHFAGNTPSSPPMGARFRLKAGFDLSPYHGDARVILEALRTYGMIVADNGTGWYISGATDSRWDDDDLDQLKSVPGAAFEVVDTGPVRNATS